MPIRVACPECQATYTCADDSRGKSLRCKKCQAVFKVEELHDPVPRRGRDGAPAGKPRKSAPRDGAEGGKPTKSRALWWVFGIVGLLLIGGVGGGLYWYFFVWTGPVINHHNPANERVTAENARLIRQGMTAAEVEAIFDRAGLVKGRIDAAEVSNDGIEEGQEIVNRWGPKAREGAVWTWGHFYERQVFVAYSARPDRGGKVVGVLGVFKEGPKQKVIEFLRLPPEAGAIPGTGEPTPAAVLTADEFIDKADTYRGKLVTVKGKINRLFVYPDGKKAQLGLATTRKKRISCDFDTWAPGLAAEGADVEVTGLVAFVEITHINLRQCELAKRK